MLNNVKYMYKYVGFDCHCRLLKLYHKLIYISFGGLFPCEILVPDHATGESRERLGFVQNKVWGYKIDKHMVLCILHTYFANGYTLNFLGVGSASARESASFVVLSRTHAMK